MKKKKKTPKIIASALVSLLRLGNILPELRQLHQGPYATVVEISNVRTRLEVQNIFVTNSSCRLILTLVYNRSSPQGSPFIRRTTLTQATLEETIARRPGADPRGEPETFPGVVPTTISQSGTGRDSSQL